MDSGCQVENRVEGKTRPGSDTVQQAAVTTLRESHVLSLVLAVGMEKDSGHTQEVEPAELGNCLVPPKCLIPKT